MQRAWLVMVVVAWLQVPPLVSSLEIGFYATRCPATERIVSRLVRLASRRDPTMPPALLRLHYHDCFVGGCDASVLLDNVPGYPLPEKMALPNRCLRGFNLVDMIKRTLEVVCPARVSCADILALSARDVVVLAGGPSWKVQTGRRDGRLSSAVLARISLPRPQFSAVQL
ncbi:peroxidase 3-like [Telopea speciosissima]|uniref:peroxidase 3-like n=1 Tax=Telopea speciosissima TaxID=54955 RepID=UPI001CC3C849|nr:peroxidase 3-like [Telopea speciosissima]